MRPNAPNCSDQFNIHEGNPSRVLQSDLRSLTCVGWVGFCFRKGRFCDFLRLSLPLRRSCFSSRTLHRQVTRLEYSFQGGGDGAHPHGGLLVYNNLLWGTNYTAGGNGYGVLFTHVGSPSTRNVVASFSTYLNVCGDPVYFSPSPNKKGLFWLRVLRRRGQWPRIRVEVEPSILQHFLEIYAFTGAATTANAPAGDLVQKGVNSGE